MKNNANFKNNGQQNGKNFNKNSNKNSEFDFEEMAYEVSVLLEGMLYFAGVKRANLEKAAEIYIENIDEILENSDFDGVDEPIAVVEYLKKNHKELFE